MDDLLFKTVNSIFSVCIIKISEWNVIFQNCIEKFLHSIYFSWYWTVVVCNLHINEMDRYIVMLKREWEGYTKRGH